jgi:hypothetical protein
MAPLMGTILAFGAGLGSKVSRPEAVPVGSGTGSSLAAAGEASFRSVKGGTKRFES